MYVFLIDDSHRYWKSSQFTRWLTSLVKEATGGEQHTLSEPL